MSKDSTKQRIIDEAAKAANISFEESETCITVALNSIFLGVAKGEPVRFNGVLIDKRKPLPTPLIREVPS